MVNILCAYVDAGFNGCTPTKMVCVLNDNGGDAITVWGVALYFFVEDEGTKL